MSCSGCKKRRLSAGQVLHGGKQIAKSISGVGLASEEVIEQRRQICRTCDKAIACTKNIKKFCICEKCGCRLFHKTRMKDEACPLGKWHRVR